MQPAKVDHDDDRIGALLARRRALEVEGGDGESGNFLFGWQCENPFAYRLLEETREQAKGIDRVRYTYLEDDTVLSESIRTMHREFGENSPQSVFCGAGAMSILFTFATYLRSLQVTEVYYLGPIYFSMHYALRLLGIRARSISALHAFEVGFKMNLPAERCILILSDPIWYAAQPTPASTLSEIQAWQTRTGSTVFVDGGFQYMSWESEIAEPTSKFDSGLTIRLVSPTKSLAVSGYRFAYALLPHAWRADFAHCYTNIYGSSNAENLVFAQLAVSAMASREITQALIAHMRHRHSRLRGQGITRSTVEPRRGFFAFEELLMALPAGYLSMGGEYFDQPRYPGYCRINLLSPSFGILLKDEL